MPEQDLPQRPKPSNWFNAPFLWGNWALAWVAIFKVLEYAGKLTVLSAAILWIAGSAERERADERTAWSVVNAKGGGRREALEHLYKKGVTLRGTYGVQAFFGDIDLHGANLQWADLTDANLDGANLAGADLSGAHLVGTSFRGANLSRVDFRRSFLDHADFNGANLSGRGL